ncbi:substrate-binding domain-containing protein [Lachnoclostridium sp.]|uniref:substrate-binding domain-containing protein n=1 Tax=Lachnoclostridium sp. TaxID=2028282 RepID=UPI0028A02558|nr:substrate-binding domain-containing protein [Lachnoclostridium sp.]
MSRYLYQEIKKYLLGVIKENQSIANYKLPSENQLALKFATTRITAKRALTELQDEGYIYRIHGKGSFISPEVAANKELKNDFICLLLPNLESKFIATIVDGVKIHLKAHGFHLIIISETEETLIKNNLISHIIDLGVKGIIVFPNSRARYNKDLLVLALNKFPVVFIDRTLHDFDVSSVTSDHLEIAKKAVQLLIDKGCQNIGFISMPPDYSSSIARRISGYEKAHVENERKIILKNMIYIKKNDPNQSEQILEFLEQNKDMDGLLSYGGQVGLNLYRAIIKTGIRVPEELKIIFIDDEYTDFNDLLPFSPTCISQRSFEIGKSAAELITSYISKKAIANDKILIDCDIIERQSTGGNRE